MTATGEATKHPSIEEVLQYAKENAKFYTGTLAHDAPAEHREEMVQNALMRAAEAYKTLDSSRGWKSFVQHHAWGAVKDYLRSGTGFRETAWDKSPTEDQTAEISASDPDNSPKSDDVAETHDDDEDSTISESSTLSLSGPRKFRQRLTTRVSIVSQESDDGELDVETIAGRFGVFSEPESEKKTAPKWDLLARLSRADDEVHLVSLLMSGFTEAELAPNFGVTRERLSQRVRRLMRRLDDPDLYNDPQTKQIIFALGLSAHFGMEPKDEGVGWDLEPVDLKSLAFHYEKIPGRGNWALFERGKASSMNPGISGLPMINTQRKEKTVDQPELKREQPKNIATRDVKPVRSGSRTKRKLRQSSNPSQKQPSRRADALQPPENGPSSVSIFPLPGGGYRIIADSAMNQIAAVIAIARPERFDRLIKGMTS